MVNKKKYMMPEIDRDEAGSQVAELIAFAEELTDQEQGTIGNNRVE